MLNELRVENLGIIADLRVVFGTGMTVITGETGAGKTLLVDALELLCGGRADPQLVREGAAEARVEGRFVDGDDEIVLARVVPADGRSRGYVNGRLATAAELAELGRDLVDLHGQHAHQSLLAPAEQRTLLDRWIGDRAREALAALRAARADVRTITTEIDALGGDERSRAREVDLLRYQLAEIDAAAIVDAEEDEQLTRESELLADADAHRAALSTAYDAARRRGGRRTWNRSFRARHTSSVCRRRGAPAARCRPRRRTSRTTCAWRRKPSSSTPIGSRPCTRGSRLCGELVRKYGPTLADVVRYGERGGGAAGAARRARCPRRGARSRPARRAKARREGRGRVEHSAVRGRRAARCRGHRTPARARNAGGGRSQWTFSPAKPARTAPTT